MQSDKCAVSQTSLELVRQVCSHSVSQSVSQTSVHSVSQSVS